MRTALALKRDFPAPEGAVEENLENSLISHLEREHATSQFAGPIPMVIGRESNKSSADLACRIALAILSANGGIPESIAILCCDPSQAMYIQRVLRHKQIANRRLLADEQYEKYADLEVLPSRTGVSVGGLTEAKGLELDSVVICGISANKYPPANAHPGTFWREASALYAAITRCRSNLFFVHTGKPSLFLSSMADFVQQVPFGEDIDASIQNMLSSEGDNER